MSRPDSSLWTAGSRWLRWDPHIHTPGTLRNNQFGVDWDAYVQAINTATPGVVALGVTDYFSLRGYKELYRRRRNGELPEVSLLFPNVELRLDLQTERGGGVNAHLLVCPDDPEHLDRIEDRLSNFKFIYDGEPFSCSDSGLISLGRRHRRDDDLADDAALQEGANQFKVEFSELHKAFTSDKWFGANVLLAVAAGKDGLSGLPVDSGFHGRREELARRAHIIFSGNPRDRSFWALGEHSDFEGRGYKTKPCLHGCDAHELDRVLVPDLDRRCWIRANATFDGLRQALAEPARRVSIGVAPPQRGSSTEIISEVRFGNAPWLPRDTLTLNDGLVAIIGSKGSGKTALAELIAYAAAADDQPPGLASFVGKAGGLLKGARVEVGWSDGGTDSCEFGQETDELRQPKVRYLSQQFVERLCSSDGLGGSLVDEIEAVVFNAVPEQDRLRAGSFAELRALKVSGLQARQSSIRERITRATRQVTEEKEVEAQAGVLKKQLAVVTAKKETVARELAEIPVPKDDKAQKEFQRANDRLQALQDEVAKAGRRVQELQDLTSEVETFMQDAGAAFSGWKARFSDLLDEPGWKALKPRLGDGWGDLARRRERELREVKSKLTGDGLTVSEADQSEGVQQMGLEALTKEHERARKALGLDAEREKRRARLMRKHGTLRADEQKISKALKNAQSAPERRRKIQAGRLDAYEGLFQSLIDEEAVLEELYKPMKTRLDAEPALEKLSFHVHRKVDARAWAARGEHLLDLRRNAPFKGSGALLKAAEQELVDDWRTGTAETVRAAMDAFLTQHGREHVENLATGCSAEDYGQWLFSTDHVEVEYGIRYEGVELARLSPGTRGVVLLTLYLGLDDWDTRPLVIDQPEENLDPRSVFDELVGFFRGATQRRQVIMVTHNANLVVNTDADQVIVASSTRQAPGQLPKIEYVAGGLEDPHIRDQVCKILEGGEKAFKDRGRRYGFAEMA